MIGGVHKYHYAFKSRENLLDLIYIVYEAITYLNHPERMELLRKCWDIFKMVGKDKISSYDYQILTILIDYTSYKKGGRNDMCRFVKQNTNEKKKIPDLLEVTITEEEVSLPKFTIAEQEIKTPKNSVKLPERTEKSRKEKFINSIEEKYKKAEVEEAELPRKTKFNKITFPMFEKEINLWGKVHSEPSTGITKKSRRR
jgi:hypothetical protein